ncbi:hypothetical protein FS749_014376 [Ceratobasidium sp. UAMH 11750]|nr:hypothetical protein FS749_014376 [Ceratobasidium sp. UAMH 11750]
MNQAKNGPTSTSIPPNQRNPESSSNNKVFPSRPRDPTYYIQGEVEVFLVGGVLFKLPMSLLTSQVEESPGFLDLVKGQEFDDSEKGKRDENPIEIPGVAASQFRSLVFVLLGTPGDLEYLSLLTDAHRVNARIQHRFVHYLDTSSLSTLFGMKSLGLWARSQLGIALRSAGVLASYGWEKATLLQAVLCARDMQEDASDVANNMLALVYLVLSFSADTSPSQKEAALNLSSSLFKDIFVFDQRPELFGCALTVILSLGHQSPVWREQLTREQRASLYVAQAHLTRLSQYPGLSLKWLASPPLTNTGACATCATHLQTFWAKTFRQCGSLDSDIPLHDVSKLVPLPQYREQLARLLSTMWCAVNCGAKEKVLHAVDSHLKEFYTGLTSDYGRIVSEL